MTGDSPFLTLLAVALSVQLRLGTKAASTVLFTVLKSGVSAPDLISNFAELFPGLPVLRQGHLDEAMRLIESSTKVGIESIPITSSKYPSGLGLIDDAPSVIYCKGSMSTLERVPGLAIVGTRKATPNGVVIAERISKHFSDRNWVIVSGLALGIDTSAHKGALIGGGRTIAVLAHGLGSVYPKQNHGLADEILGADGLLLSEYPLGFPAKPEQFVLRNRIQIGLSAGSVIVEGEEKSGTKTQAEYCLRNKRHLFAVVPNDATELLNLTSALPMQLVSKRGAIPIYTRGDYDRVEYLITAKRRELALVGRPPF
jgi:DNA processing protein